MTLRSLIIGILAVVAVATMGYMSVPLGLGFFIEHHLPVIAFGSLIVFLMTIGPLLSWTGESRRLKPSEMAVILTLVLAACSVPERGIMRQLPNILAMPIQTYQLTPGWQKNDLMKYAPTKYMPGEGKYDEEVMGPYISGAGRPGDPIGLRDVPWRKWRKPLLMWLPMAFLMSISCICLGVIVHRQWSQRERLRYPLADVTVTLMSQTPGRKFPDIFREQWFLIALALVFVIRLVNGIHAWNPGFIQIPLYLDLSAAQQKWPDFFRVEWSNGFTMPRFFPIILGFAFLLASDISLSLGLTQIAFVIFGYAALRSGLDLSTEYMRGGVMAWNRFGGYSAFTLIMLYAGRRYYGNLVREAFLLQRRSDVNGVERWSARVLFLSFCLTVGLLIQVGMEWPFAFLTIGLILMMFLGVARINAETGLFFVQARWQVMGVFLGLFGPYALGPKLVILAGMTGAILGLDPSHNLLGFVTNGLRICERTGVSVRRAAGTALGGWIWALLIVTPLAFWYTYNHGVAGIRDRWPIESIPTMIYRAANSVATELSLSKELTESETMRPLERFLHMRPEKGFVWGASAGFVLVLIMAFLRLRLSWWPLHPVLFLVWSTHPMFLYSFSFLLGWILKTGVVRIGGMNAYHRTKPFMIGLIAGDLLSAFFWIVVGGIYRLSSGLEPPIYQILQ